MNLQDKQKQTKEVRILKTTYYPRTEKKEKIKLLTKRHNFIVSKWETSPVKYGQDTENSYAIEYTCSRCGTVSDKYSFLKTDCY